MLYIARLIGASSFGQLSLLFAVSGSLARLVGNPISQRAMAAAQEGKPIAAAGALKSTAVPSFLGALVGFGASYVADLGLWVALLASVLVVAWGISAAMSGIARGRGMEMLGLALLPGPGSLVGFLGLAAMIMASRYGFQLSATAFVGVVAFSGAVSTAEIVRTDQSQLAHLGDGLSLTDLVGLQISEDLFAAGDIWLMGFLGVNPGLLGSVALAKRIAQVVGLPMALAATILAPKANISTSSRSSVNLKSTLDWSRTSSIAGLLSCLMAASILTFVPVIFDGIFGESFVESRGMAIVLILGSVPLAVLGPSRLFLVLSGATRIVLWIEVPILFVLGVGIATSGSGGQIVSVIAGSLILRGVFSAIALSKRWGLSVGLVQRMGIVS